jgi:hypothetical protein
LLIHLHERFEVYEVDTTLLTLTSSRDQVGVDRQLKRREVVAEYCVAEFEKAFSGYAHGVPPFLKMRRENPGAVIPDLHPGLSLHSITTWERRYIPVSYNYF